MNERRRNALLNSAVYLDKASDIIRNTAAQESFAMDGVPENLRASPQFDRMEDAVYAMEEAIQSINDAKDSLAEACA